MTDHGDYIEHDAGDRRDLVEHQARPPAQTQQTAPPATFNPLGADPEALAASMARHQQNRTSLREWLLANLQPGRDFGAVHVVKTCDDKYRCTNPYHYSEDTLFAPGAETVRTILGLGARYPGMEAYRTAALSGVKIQDVVVTCEIVDGHGRVIAESTGAASVAEHQGSLHNTLAKAQKRAAVNAVRELPTVRTLFQGSKTLPDGSSHGSAGSPNAADLQRSEQQRPRCDDRNPERKRPPAGTRDLEVMPFGRHKGAPFSQLDGKYLAWCATLTDKPDVAAAARRELDRRSTMEPEMPHTGPDAYAGPAAADDFDDEGPPPDAYFR